MATATQRISAVSFYTAADDVDFTVNVYRHFNGDALFENRSSQIGSAELRGLHTLDLETPVEVQAGDTFYVAVTLSDGGHAFDRTSSVDVLLGVLQGAATVPSISHEGESMYLINGQCVITSYSIHYTKLYEMRQAEIPRPFRRR